MWSQPNQISEKKNELASVVPKSKSTKRNILNWRIEELTAKNNTKQEICKADNSNTLEET